MQPLIDADVLLYETGFAVESTWQSAGFPPFDFAAESIDMRIANICAMVDATEEPILYLTGKGNFRYDIATRTPYKDRPSNKPFHYKNLKAYVKGKYEYVETVGMEADDALAIEQTKRPSDTIVCTRDKDLRAVTGWHYGWELFNQPQFGPEKVEGFGYLTLSPYVKGKSRTLKGVGEIFFYAQCLMGDSVDSIPGLIKGTGPVKAYEVLEGCTTPKEAFKAVLEAYRGVHGDNAEAYLLEQGRLLHMTRYLDEWGNPILWSFPYDVFQD